MTEQELRRGPVSRNSQPPSLSVEVPTEPEPLEMRTYARRVEGIQITSFSPINPDDELTKDAVKRAKASRALSREAILR